MTNLQQNCSQISTTLLVQGQKKNICVFWLTTMFYKGLFWLSVSGSLSEKTLLNIRKILWSLTGACVGTCEQFHIQHHFISTQVVLLGNPKASLKITWLWRPWWNRWNLSSENHSPIDGQQLYVTFRNLRPIGGWVLQFPSFQWRHDGAWWTSPITWIKTSVNPN